MEYKPTIFDRHGPAAADIVRAWGYGLMTFGLSLVLYGALGAGLLGYRGWFVVIFVLGMSALTGFVAGRVGLMGANVAGEVVHEVMMSGSGTPYQEQFSYEQALVMKGEVAQALQSFERRIAEPNSLVDARIRAAELYAREGANPRRASELFRDVQRHPRRTPGQDTYATNRLVDLLTGPLQDPGRALVELRHLIERYPNAPSAVNARAALSSLKEAAGAERRAAGDG